ncbi:hypothetical protein ACH4F6_11345 [Streptomyces sp. NPDC017936]|uniref:hypothetical protein n=1 Tax=Streptomyces sp. NPDC017936 TaxID=3365016 RepID=UPI0037A1536B
MSIIHALLRWILGACTPGNGRHRAGASPTVGFLACEAETTEAVAVPLPAHRSPYGLPVPLDGRATVSVRPYVLAAEREDRERERERAR